MRLKSRETLRALMNQAGISTRMLAASAGDLHHSTIDHLLMGRRERLRESAARRIAGTLHAPFDLLWEPYPDERGAR